MTRIVLSLVIAALVLTVTPASFAGGDHDHDAAPRTSGALSPRFAARSAAFEVVGVLQGDALPLYVDRFDDNAPVLGAKVEIESGAFRAVGTFHADSGDYRFAAATFKEPGSYPIQITITADRVTDLLAADFVVPDPHAGHDHSQDDALLITWGLGGAGVVLVALAGWWMVRRRRRLRFQGLAS